MPDGQQTVSVAGRQEHGPVARVAIAKVLILLGLVILPHHINQMIMLLLIKVKGLGVAEYRPR